MYARKERIQTPVLCNQSQNLACFVEGLFLLLLLLFFIGGGGGGGGGWDLKKKKKKGGGGVFLLFLSFYEDMSKWMLKNSC